MEGTKWCTYQTVHSVKYQNSIWTLEVYPFPLNDKTELILFIASWVKMDLNSESSSVPFHYVSLSTVHCHDAKRVICHSGDPLCLHILKAIAFWSNDCIVAFRNNEVNIWYYGNLVDYVVTKAKRCKGYKNYMHA